MTEQFLSETQFFEKEVEGTWVRCDKCRKIFNAENRFVCESMECPHRPVRRKR